jgi:hypothetical protein
MLWLSPPSTVKLFDALEKGKNFLDGANYGIGSTKLSHNSAPVDLPANDFTELKTGVTRV